MVINEINYDDYKKFSNNYFGNITINGNSINKDDCINSFDSVLRNSNIFINFKYKRQDSSNCMQLFNNVAMSEIIKSRDDPTKFDRFGLRKLKYIDGDKGVMHEHQYVDAVYTDVIYNKIRYSESEFNPGLPYYAIGLLDLNKSSIANKDLNKVFVRIRTPYSYLSVMYWMWRSNKIYDPYCPSIANGTCYIGNVTVSDYPCELARWLDAAMQCYEPTHPAFESINKCGISLNTDVRFNGISFGSMHSFENYLNLTLYCRSNNMLTSYKMANGDLFYGYIEPYDSIILCANSYKFNKSDKIHLKSTPNLITDMTNLGKFNLEPPTYLLLQRPADRKYEPKVKTGRPKGSTNRVHKMISVKHEARDPWDVWADKY